MVRSFLRSGTSAVSRESMGRNLPDRLRTCFRNGGCSAGGEVAARFEGRHRLGFCNALAKVMFSGLGTTAPTQRKLDPQQPSIWVFSRNKRAMRSSHFIE